jgi:hypothetical protein
MTTTANGVSTVTGTQDHVQADRRNRLAGAGGLLFVLLLVVDNAIRAGAPQFGDSGAPLTAYVEAHRTAMIVPIAVFPLGMIGLFAFVTGVWSAAGSDVTAQWWAHLGTLAVVAIAGLFSVVNLVEGAMVAAVHDLAPSPAVVTALWAMDGAAFGLNLAAIGVALFALSRSARASDLIPAWIAHLAVPGAACLLLASVFAVEIAAGAAWLFVGLVGFLVWALFVLMTSVSLARRTPRVAEA